jgi:hypothetical protein
MHRYGRALPKAGEAILQLPVGKRSTASQIKNTPYLATDLSSSPGSSQPATMHAHNSEDAYDCEPPVNSRDTSPPPAESSNQCEIENAHLASRRERQFEGNKLEAGLGTQCSFLNETTSFSPQPSAFNLLQPDWLQLSPYGDFPHTRGLQRVDRAAAETMVVQFNSLRARLGRLFGGAPFFVGHPDLPSAHELSDRKAYGWVMQLQAREDGLYGQVKWSEAGLELLKNAHYKYLSPYWEGKQIGTESGKPVFRPFAFLSVGLTNTPNIPVKPLANSVGMPSTASLDSAVKTPSAPIGSCSQSTRTHSPECKMADAHSSIKYENANSAASARLVINQPDPGLSVGPHLAARLPNLHTRSITENIALRRAERVPLHNRRQRIHNAVKSKMRLGLKYNAAWEEVKNEHQDWFANEQ